MNRTSLIHLLSLLLFLLSLCLFALLDIKPRTSYMPEMFSHLSHQFYEPPISQNVAGVPQGPLSSVDTLSLSLLLALVSLISLVLSLFVFNILAGSLCCIPKSAAGSAQSR